MDAGKEKWYDIATAAKEAGVSRPTLTKAAREGRLRASQVSGGRGKTGHHYLISESALIEWMNDRKSVKDTVAAVNAVHMSTVEELAAELNKRIQDAYDKGFRDGEKATKNAMQKSLKDLFITK